MDPDTHTSLGPRHGRYPTLLPDLRQDVAQKKGTIRATVLVWKIGICKKAVNTGSKTGPAATSRDPIWKTRFTESDNQIGAPKRQGQGRSLLLMHPAGDLDQRIRITTSIHSDHN